MPREEFIEEEYFCEKGDCRGYDDDESDPDYEGYQEEFEEDY